MAKYRLKTKMWGEKFHNQLMPSNLMSFDVCYYFENLIILWQPNNEAIYVYMYFDGNCDQNPIRVKNGRYFRYYIINR